MGCYGYSRANRRLFGFSLWLQKKLLSLSFQKETAKLGVSDWDRVRDEDREGDRGGNSDKDGDREGDREGQTWTLLLCLDRRIKGSQV